MTEFLQPRSYVREFNAASLAEALKYADQALRMDGVTVAVWKKIDESLPAGITGKKKIFFQAMSRHLEDLMRDTTISQYMAQIRTDFKKFAPPDVLSTHRSEINERLKLKVSALPDPREFLITDVMFVNEYFAFARGRITLEINASRPVIHRDGYHRFPFVDKGLFDGKRVRFLQNIVGTPTEFYIDQGGKDLYSLGAGDAVFFIAGRCEQSAWHSATWGAQKPRIIYTNDFSLNKYDL